MARYAKDQKQATRQRIIDTAGRRFKQDGIDGSGIATLMSDAGLTNGAFYAHFASKDDLVAVTVADQLQLQGSGFAALAAQPGGLERIIRSYLSVEHRDNPGGGCPSAALLDEIGRCPDAIKQNYTDGLLAVVDAIAAQMSSPDPSTARVAVLNVFALMAGTVQISRALTDRVLADQVLEQGVQTAVALLAGQSTGNRSDEEHARRGDRGPRAEPMPSP
ncbi:MULTISPECIES: TetR family transcriptional regulator [unclassified Mycobacteroides]|uniref:TetR/AcrR family transcriptional regulator n=1 Tax=unclassified Mycobacteroides TaxID=2618759 RepID=UPI0009E9B26F|nr:MULTISPECIES: TetR family transcriptional regulator [unclassified Mycobacteroides]